jgi:hypothetical protein
MAQLSGYPKKAPYYTETIELVHASLDSVETHIARLNVRILENVCAWIGIDFHYDFFSEMDLELGAIDGPGSWALRISEALGAQAYLNPPGGAELFDPIKFAESGITLRIQEFQNKVYDCRPWDFVPGLSIIDVMMWNAPGEILAYLNGQNRIATLGG